MYKTKTICTVKPLHPIHPIHPLPNTIQVSEGLLLTNVLTSLESLTKFFGLEPDFSFQYFMNSFFFFT